DRRSDDDLQVGDRIDHQRYVGERRAVAEPEQQTEHDQHADPEAGHGQEQDAEEARDIVAEAVGAQRADDGDGNADDPRQYHRERGDLGGERSAPQQHVGDAFGTEERPAEIAVEDVADPASVLHNQRIAEAQLLHVAGALLDGEFGQAFRPEDGDEGIARQDTQHHEHQDRHGNDRDRTKGQTTGDVTVHGL